MAGEQSLHAGRTQSLGCCFVTPGLAGSEHTEGGKGGMAGARVHSQKEQQGTQCGHGGWAILEEGVGVLSTPPLTD